MNRMNTTERPWVLREMDLVRVKFTEAKVSQMRAFVCRLGPEDIEWLREVPHKGWTCTCVEDLEEPCEICEMCESQEIRYVHTMAHPRYPEALRCGRICAGQMERDYAAAWKREAELKRRGRKPRRKAAYGGITQAQADARVAEWLGQRRVKFV